MEKYFHDIGKQIKYIRKERELTQVQLAERAELSVSYVYRIEAGDVHLTVKTLIKIAEALDVPVDVLLSEKDTASVNIEKLQMLLNDNSQEEIRFFYHMLKQFKTAKELYLK